jgi:hypothetical protein
MVYFKIITPKKLVELYICRITQSIRIHHSAPIIIIHQEMCVEQSIYKQNLCIQAHPLAYLRITLLLPLEEHYILLTMQSIKILHILFFKIIQLVKEGELYIYKQIHYTPILHTASFIITLLLPLEERFI